MENFNKLVSLVKDAEADAAKTFEKGNAAAGTRFRKTMMEIKNLAHTLRAEATEAVKK